MIHLKQASFSYGSKLVLQPIDLSIFKEDRLAFIGPSGCGKSTLLEIILGYKKLTQGHILYDGPQVSFGVVFQQNDLLPWMNVANNIRISSKKSVDSFPLEKLGLFNLENHFPDQLSGGQQKRVSLARALTQKPDVLLLDEPFVGIDQLTSELILQDLKRVILEEKQTMLLVTHHIQEAVFLAKKIIIFSGMPGKISAVLDNPFYDEKDFHALSLATFAQKVRYFLT